MALTSAAFRALTITLAVLATVGVLLLWNRVRGPRPVRLISRVGLLLSGYAFTAVAVLVAINVAYGGLIANWGDLFADPNAGFGMHGKFPGHGRFHGKLPPGMQPPPGGWPGMGAPGGPAMPGGPGLPGSLEPPGGPGQVGVQAGVPAGPDAPADGDQASPLAPTAPAGHGG